MQRMMHKKFVCLLACWFILMGYRVHAQNPYTTGLVLDLDASAGVWKDAAKTSAATTAGDLVWTWADQSGAGNDVVQATSGNRPNFQPSIVNSLPVIRFTGSPICYLSNTTNSLPSQTQTFFIVYSPVSRNLQNVLLAEGTTGTFQFYQNNGGFYDIFDTSAHQNANGTLTALRGFQLITIVTNGVTATIHQNGTYANTTLSGSLANNTLTGLTIGATNTGTLPLNGDIARVLIYNATVSGTNITAVESYLLAKYGIPTTYSIAIPLVVTEGDSLTNGTNTALNTQEWPEQSYQGVHGQANYLYFNPAVGGSQYTDLTNRATYVDSLYSSARGTGKNIIVVWAGTNDIWLTGQTASQTYSRLQTYCLARKATGWKTVVVTMIPRQYNNASGPANETIRQAFNALIRGNAGGAADVICDPGNDPAIGTAQADGNTTYFSADRIHMTFGGYGIVGNYIGAAITKALATNPVSGGTKRKVQGADGLIGVLMALVCFAQFARMMRLKWRMGRRIENAKIMHKRFVCLLACWLMLAGVRVQAQFVSDTFPGTAGTALESHTADVGGQWVKNASPGTGAIVLDGLGGVRNNTNSVIGLYHLPTAPATTEYDVQVTVTFNADGYYDIASHVTAATYFGYLGGRLPGSWAIYRVNGATPSGPVASSTTPTFTTGSTYTLKLSTRLSGSNLIITLYVNGVQSCTYTDTAPFAAGYPGFWLYSGASTNASTAVFSNYYANNLVFSAPAVSFSGTTATSTTISWGSAVFGTSPYTYQLQRAPDASGSPGTFANVSGATTSPYTDSGLTTNTKYWYRVVATDSTTATANGAASSVFAAVPAINQVVFKGDSLTYGQFASSGGGTTSGTVYPAVSMVYLGSTWAGVNKGVMGQQVTTMVTNGASEIDSLFNAGTYTGGQIAVLEGGTNDIGATSNSAASIYASIVSWHNTRRVAGWKTVATTIMHSGYATGYTRSGTANFNPVADAVNALIRANWRTFANALADIASDSRLLDATNTTYFQSDQTHLTDSGYAIMAQYETPAIWQAITSSVAPTGTKRKVQ